MGDHSSENYLDQLLNSMHGEETEHPKEQQAAKQVLRDDFEKQLFGEEETKEKAKAKNKAKREAKKIELAELEADTRPNAELNGLDEAQTEEAVADAAYIAAVNASFEE